MVMNIVPILDVHKHQTAIAIVVAMCQIHN